MNFIGLTAALTAFFSIWFGHVAVRKIESSSPTIWIPTTIFAAVGFFLELLSLFMVRPPGDAGSRSASVVFGILGTTLLFDALEFTLQQNRIRKGHAPANPKNPRHAKILAQHASATTLDLLKREPSGNPIYRT